MLAAICSRAARRRRRAGGLTAGELDEAVGHVELAVARLDDGAHVGAGVEAQQRRHLEVLAFAADVEAGGDGRRVLVDDDGHGAHACGRRRTGLDLDGHGALVERAERRGENDGLAGGIDGAAGKHPGADLVPGRTGLHGRGCQQQHERIRGEGGGCGKDQAGAAHAAIPSFFHAPRVCPLAAAATMARPTTNAAPSGVDRHHHKSEV